MRGRPPKHKAITLTADIRVRTTDTHRLKLEAWAAAAGMTTAEYIRWRLEGPRHPERPALYSPDPAHLPDEVLAQLVRIGSNVNQIARRLNATGEAPAHTADTLMTLKELIASLSQERTE